jgi:hypothetical protein
MDTLGMLVGGVLTYYSIRKFISALFVRNLICVVIAIGCFSSLYIFEFKYDDFIYGILFGSGLGSMVNLSIKKENNGNCN